MAVLHGPLNLLCGKNFSFSFSETILIFVILNTRYLQFNVSPSSKCQIFDFPYLILCVKVEVGNFVQTSLEIPVYLVMNCISVKTVTQVFFVKTLFMTYVPTMIQTCLVAFINNPSPLPPSPILRVY